MPPTPPFGPAEPRYSRRQMLAAAGGVAGALSLGPLLAACGSASTPPPPPVGDAAWWGAQHSTGQLVFANWPLYIDYRNWLKSRPSLNEFSRDTGIAVTYEEVIQGIESFYNRIKPQLSANRPTGFDLIVLTNGWQLTELIRNGWLLPLDHSLMPNFARYAGPLARNPAYDPGNRYTVAWQSGFTGIAYNRHKISRRIHSIKDLWDPAFQGRVGMMNDNTDLGSAGLMFLGIDPATSTESDWKKAAGVLQAQKEQGLVHKYYSQDYIDALQNGDTWITQAWSGDIFQARASGYPELEFVVPDEGVMHWTDNLMIPMHAANPRSAMEWINFYYSPKIAARVVDWVEYITPVPDAQAIIEHRFHDPSVAHSDLVFPTPSMQSKVHNYRVFQSASEYDAWNDTFDPIITG